MSDPSNGNRLELIPEPAPGALPPFHKLDEYVFQDLCRDLFDSEPTVTHCEVYGKRGQKQRGIDLIAPRPHNQGLEVGQCKRYERFSPAQVKKASDEFFTHWVEHWHPRKVKRFILFVACDLSDAGVQEQIILQRERFAAIGVEYETWSAAKIRNALGPRRDIVGRYMWPADVWVDLICGPTAHAPLQNQASVINAALSSQLVQLTDRLTGEVGRRIDALWNAWREGRKDEARAGVRDLKTDTPTWSMLPGEVKARVLRFEAVLVLHDPDGVEQARTLADQSRSLNPQENLVRLEAMIETRRGNYDAALALLQNHNSTDDRHIKAAILLNRGQVGEALAMVDPVSGDFEATAESFRLQTLAHLAAGNLKRARLASQRAIELAPTWDTVRSAAGAVDYFSALSPAALSEGIPEWPIPVDWTLVRRDDVSLDHLRNAAVRFHELARLVDSDSDQRQAYESWELACLANDPDRQDEAAALCRDLLARAPVHPGAIAWGVSRRYEVDWAIVERALLDRIADTTETQPVLSILTCYLTWGRAEDAHRIIEDTKARFELHQHSGTWTFWYVQVLIAVGQEEQALHLIEEKGSHSPFQDLRIYALRRRAARTGEWLSFAAELYSEHERAGGAELLLQACGIMAEEGEWSWVADRAEKLIDLVRTADALRLGAIATFQSDRPDLFLKLLDEHLELFRHHKLPPDLRLMRVRALRALGLVPRAVAEAEQLARDDASIKNLLHWAQLLYQTGDFAAVSRVAQDLVGREDLNARSALRLCHLLANQDRTMALRLWRLATHAGIPDDTIGLAFDLSLRLNTQQEIAPYLARLHELGEQGLNGILRFDSAELSAMVSGWAKDAERVRNAYLQGTVPVHLALPHLDSPLISLYHRRLDTNAQGDSPARQFALRIRHGSRGIPIPLPERPPEWRLHADITALLLAHHLEILDAVEQHYGSIRIEENLIVDLVRLRDELAVSEPTYLRADQELLELIDSGLLHRLSPEIAEPLPGSHVLGDEHAALLATAEGEGGFVLDYRPLQTTADTPTDLSARVGGKFINLRTIVEALWEHGPLSESERDTALADLGTHGVEDTAGDLPAPYARIVCCGNTAPVLAAAGMLRLACQKFRMYLHEQTVTATRDRIASAAASRTDADWVSILINRLRMGLMDGRYEVLPPVSIPKPEEGKELDLPFGLSALFTFRAEPGDVLWIDDRATTAHWSRNGAPIFGIVEVLEGMLQRGTINESVYYAALLRLKAGNARFLPLTAEEILYHLAAARVHNGSVIETRALSILRRYTASCLLDDGLQSPTGLGEVENDRSEVAVLVGVQRAVAHAIGLAWDTPQEQATRGAWADWIYDNLYLDVSAARRAVGIHAATDDDRGLAAFSLADLITLAFRMNWTLAGVERENRKAYIEWLDRQVLENRFSADPLLLPLVAEHLKQLLLTRYEEDTTEEIRAIALRLLLDELPARVQERLATDPEFVAQLAVQTVSMIEVGPYRFEVPAFRVAAAAALEGEATSILPLAPSRSVRFEPDDEPRDGLQFRLHDPEKAEPIFVSHSLFGIFSSSPTKRESYLREHPEWFDGPLPAFERWIADMASMEELDARVEAVERWYDGSPIRYYRDLAETLARTASVGWDALRPPVADRLIQHFRLDPSARSATEAGKVLEAAARDLIQEEGLDVAYERWAGLPVPLAGSIMDAVLALDPETRKKLIKRLLGYGRSPVSDLHLLRVLWLFANESAVYRRLANRRTAQLFEEVGSQRTSGFLTILKWVGQSFDTWAETSSWSAHLRLAVVWLHAHRLFAILEFSVGEMGTVAGVFKGAQHRFSVRTLSDQPGYYFDVANPGRIEALPFVLAGLSYAMKGVARHNLDKRVSALATVAAWKESETGSAPEVTLLRHPDRARNTLGSFLDLRSDRPLTLLLGRERARRISGSGLDAWMGELTEHLVQNPRDINAWSMVWAIQGDLPPKKAVAEVLQKLVHGADFQAFLQEEPVAGGIPLVVAASMASHFRDEQLRSHLRQSLVAIARELAKTHPAKVDLFSEQAPTSASHLLNATFALAKSIEVDKVLLSGFVDLFGDLLAAWPAIGPTIEIFVRRAWQELPMQEAQQFARLLTQVRAE